MSENISAVPIISNQVSLSIATIRIGDILKLSKTDPFPSLEVSVEIENDKIHAEDEFIYLHNIENKFEEIKNKFCVSVERLEWAPNIGKAYILLDFDKSKKYIFDFLRI